MFNRSEKHTRNSPQETPSPTAWDNLRAENFAGNTEPVNPEQAKAERQQRKITAYFLHDKNLEYINARDVKLNPKDTERLYEQLLNGIITNQDKQVLINSITTNTRNPADIAHKRNEYSTQIRTLEIQASEWQKQHEMTPTPHTGERIKNLIKDYDYYEMSRAQAAHAIIANNPGDRLPPSYNEDAHLEMPAQNLFAVFDGVGGTNNIAGGAQIASHTAANTIFQLANQFDLKTEKNLAWALNQASQAIESNPRAGLTTAAIARVIEQNGQKKLAYASAGDSRIYIVRERSEAYQITRDEGEGKFITNSLGAYPNQSSQNRTKQYGLVDLWPGDRIVLCTDGVTGDTPEDSLNPRNIAATVGLSWDSHQASAELVEIARKKDDRTAIVFEV